MRRAWLLTSLVALGCGPSDYRDFREQLVQRACKRDRRCGVIGSAEPGCGMPAALALTMPGPLDVPTDIGNGRLAFHSGDAQDCLDSVESAPCEPAAAQKRFAQHCHGVIGPAAPAGGDCYDDEECVGSRCVHAGLPGCRGRCVPYPMPGSLCVSDGGIGDGGAPVDCDPTVQYCGGDPPRCQRHKQSGDPCSGSNECSFGLVCRTKCGPPPRTPDGQPCDDAAPCADSSYCDGSGRCAALRPSGQSCEAADGCVSGFGCQGVLEDGGTRQVCAAWRNVGDACVAVPGGTGCPESQFCGPGGSSDGGSGGFVCAITEAIAGPHQPCADRPCARGLYCANDQQCAFIVGWLGDCDPNERSICDAGLHCDPTSHHCERAIACADTDGGAP